MPGKWKERDEPPKRTNRGYRKQEETASDRTCQTCKGTRTVKGKTCPACKGVGGVNIRTV